MGRVEGRVERARRPLRQPGGLATFLETAPNTDVAPWSTPLYLFPNIGKVPSIW
jgi:hypothetical protein